MIENPILVLWQKWKHLVNAVLLSFVPRLPHSNRMLKARVSPNKYDFLAQDLAQAEELGLTDLVDRIRAKREQLLGLI